MAEIDMIPRSYREAMRVRRSLTMFGVTLICLLAGATLVHAALLWRVGVSTALLQNSRSRMEHADAIAKAFETSRSRKAALEQSLSALRALRGSGETARLAGAIDAAVSSGVWFKELSFTRNEQLVAAGAPAVGQAAYSFKLPVENAGKVSATETQTWRLVKNLEITGEAVDYAALTAFMRMLAQQPAIGEVRLVSSNLPPSGDGVQVVGFNITAVMVPPASP
jgi:hypothetical protein